MGRERVEEDEDEGWRCLNEGDGGGGGDPAGQRFFDRSKVRILLCDNDPKSSREILQLLLKCSYQGISLLFSTCEHISSFRFCHQNFYLIAIKNQKGFTANSAIKARYSRKEKEKRFFLGITVHILFLQFVGLTLLFN